MRGVMIFSKKGKHNSRYIGLYKISKKVDNVAYELDLPQELVVVHPVFHIHMLKKFLGDSSLNVTIENIYLKDSLSYQEISVRIFDRQVCKFRTLEDLSVKVLGRNQFVEETTWEAKDYMKTRYPHLFIHIDIDV
ncbi:hypothetical protein MTR67_007115 [Solanum verrucosum]|uniref:Tf2-1-like SH3-like domain-containing protein n=1 Tax=Solanum verrucosum TaxID=315347 RepID=A0AAF0Q1F6_SOLVR|nr:hypothetical protein MTR67_007115 [Solanum verrucosum]